MWLLAPLSRPLGERGVGGESGQANTTMPKRQHNPSATGRVAYEGLRTLGVAPDSVAPGQYNFTPTEVRNQTPISYINAILGTTPDWQEKKTMKLMKALNNE